MGALDPSQRQAHWATVYATKRPDEVSWYEREPATSLRLVTSVAPSHDARIIDVGAGASALIDVLLRAGYRTLTALDLSADALASTRTRLGDAGSVVAWQAGDVLLHPFDADAFDVWHDRAVFHFMTTDEARQQYVAQVRRALRIGGYVVLETFADDGPARCSGLDVCRYAPDALLEVIGPGFTCVEQGREEHLTPAGAVQRFAYVVCRRGA